MLREAISLGTTAAIAAIAATSVLPFFSTEGKTTKENNSYNLVQVVEIIEQIIETHNRFEAYLVEVQLLQQLGMSFQDWLQLSPPTKARQNEMERIYIIPFQPLDLK
jgi:hypothetical protein